MLPAVLRDMYIAPELLNGLDDDQKQTLFASMRQEQLRRYRERELSEMIENSNKQDVDGRRVTFNETEVTCFIESGDMCHADESDGDPSSTSDVDLITKSKKPTMVQIKNNRYMHTKVFAAKDATESNEIAQCSISKINVDQSPTITAKVTKDDNRNDTSHSRQPRPPVSLQSLGIDLAKFPRVNDIKAALQENGILG